MSHQNVFILFKNNKVKNFEETKLKLAGFH